MSPISLDHIILRLVQHCPLSGAHMSHPRTRKSSLSGNHIAHSLQVSSNSIAWDFLDLDSYVSLSLLSVRFYLIYFSYHPVFADHVGTYACQGLTGWMERLDDGQLGT